MRYSWTLQWARPVVYNNMANFAQTSALESVQTTESHKSKEEMWGLPDRIWWKFWGNFEIHVKSEHTLSCYIYLKSLN